MTERVGPQHEQRVMIDDSLRKDEARRQTPDGSLSATGEPDAGDLLDLSIALTSGYAARTARRPLRAAFEAWAQWSARRSLRRCGWLTASAAAHLSLTHAMRSAVMEHLLCAKVAPHTR